ncbi:PadR family transcriptional regulator [Gemmatimonadota bacterium]
MTRTTASTIYGNLDLLVLHTLRVEGSLHGLGIVDVLEERSQGSIQVDIGALYRSLHRLEKHGLLESEWRISDKNRKANYYSLTAAGEKDLERTQDEWEDHVRAISRVLSLGWEIGS